MQVKLRINETVEQNAAHYFEESKKAKHKMEGAQKTVDRYRAELNRLEEKKEEEIELLNKKEEEKAQRASRPQKWYHKFRWFVTSDGLLAVGGRDATSNEVLIKKHAEPGDLVFHTDMAGSPFFVVKTGGKKASPESIREAADATCTFSRAWKLGMGAQDVFWVTPEQVSKTAQSGEYLTRGAFVIRGKANYVDNKVNLALGVDADGFVMGGPYSAVKAHCKTVVRVEQGDKKPSDIAKQIAKKIDADVDEIVRVLPSGEFRFVRD